MTVTQTMTKPPTASEQRFAVASWLPRNPPGEIPRPDRGAANPRVNGVRSVAGVPVQAGLYAAPLALVAYALFGGSRLLVF